MNPQIIKIEMQGGNEVAYVLTDGKVVKMLIEDRTGLPLTVNQPVLPRGNMEPVSPWPPRNVVNTPAPTAGGTLVPKGFAPPKPILPDRPAPLKPPPGLAGVFIPEGEPGAAIETRRVG